MSGLLCLFRPAQKHPTPQQVDSLYRQGLAALQAGDLPKARAAFEQV